MRKCLPTATSDSCAALTPLLRNVITQAEKIKLISKTRLPYSLRENARRLSCSTFSRGHWMLLLTLAWSHVPSQCCDLACGLGGRQTLTRIKFLLWFLEVWPWSRWITCLSTGPMPCKTQSLAPVDTCRIDVITLGSSVDREGDDVLSDF